MRVDGCRGRTEGDDQSVTNGFDSVLCASLRLNIHTCIIINALAGSSVGHYN